MHRPGDGDYPQRGTGGDWNTILRPITLATGSSFSLCFFADPLPPQARAAKWEKENWGEGTEENRRRNGRTPRHLPIDHLSPPTAG